MLPGIDTGGGGLSNSSSAAAQSGDADGTAGGSSFNFSFGGNPNVSTNNYMVIGAVAVAGLLLWMKLKRK